VSHSKEREEKKCLNCGTAVEGRFCQVCGQENTEPKETFWSLISHFFNDITHFDGKFFSTVNYLIRKPGFLTAEYIKGRRASYLHPIRMYVFTSAFFFLIFFSFFNPVDQLKNVKDNALELKDLTEASASLKQKSATIKDPDLKAAIQRSIAHIDEHAAVLHNIVLAEEQVNSARRSKTKSLLDSAGVKLNSPSLLPQNLLDSIAANSRQNENGQQPDIDMRGMEAFDYHSKIAYDSVQKELPAEKRDGFFKKRLVNSVVAYQARYKDDPRETRMVITEKMLHTVPQGLFVSLPLFAFILMLLYKRRNFFYAEHAIFTIHLYCAFFLLLLVYFSIDKIQLTSGWKWLTLLKNLVVLSMFFYLYKAMRRFYQQGRGKTILKFVLLNIVFFTVVVALMFAFIALSVMQFS